MSAQSLEVSAEAAYLINNFEPKSPDQLAWEKRVRRSVEAILMEIGLPPEFPSFAQTKLAKLAAEVDEEQLFGMQQQTRSLPERAFLRGVRNILHNFPYSYD